MWFDYHGLRNKFGENVQGGGFSSREVLAALLGDGELGDEDAGSEDAEREMRTRALAQCSHHLRDVCEWTQSQHAHGL